MLASSQGQIDSVQMLVSRGANIDSIDDQVRMGERKSGDERSDYRVEQHLFLVQSMVISLSSIFY